MALLANVVLNPAKHWRATFAISSAPALALFWGMLGWCADSPADARVHSQAIGIVRSVAVAVAVATSPAAQLKPRPPGRYIGVWLGCALFLCQQFSGINAVIYFSSRIFQDPGVGGPSGALIASIAVGVFNIAGTLFAMAVIEKAGRRSLLIASYGGMATNMLAMGASFVVPMLKPYAHAITLLGTVLFVLSLAVGAGPVTGLLVPELNDTTTRSRAVSAAILTHWIANVAVGQGFLPAVQAFGLGSVYLGFGAWGVLASGFVAKCVPETRGKSLEQSDTLPRKRHTTRQATDAGTNVDRMIPARPIA